jgi:hypothetical protein
LEYGNADLQTEKFADACRKRGSPFVVWEGTVGRP